MKRKPQSILKKSAGLYRANRWLFFFRLVVLLSVVAFFVVKRNFWTPDTLFIALLVVAAAFGEVRAFLIRFVPLAALLLVYDSFRGFADNLNQHVNYYPMINFDRFIFGGHLPTVVLQWWLWHGHTQWYDFYFYFLYTMHFLMPFLVAVLIWKVRERLYWQYMWALVGLSFAAFITFAIFPAAPPWMASDYGYIEHIHRISSDVWYAMGVTNFSELYGQLSPNQVAAVPSLHSAYPLLLALFITRVFGIKRTWWVYIYPLSMWLGVVYLGEHYIFDVLSGIVYAVVAYAASDRYFKWHHSPHRRWHRPVQRRKARLAPVFVRRT